MTINKYIGAVAVTTLLTVGMAAHAAPGNGKGERASLAGVTVCEVYGTTLHATARLTNESTGNAIPFVEWSSFQGLAKVGTGNWKQSNWADDAIVPFQLAYGDFTGQVPSSVDINAYLDLCELKDIVGDVKALNVMATIKYDRNDADGGDDKYLQNMCGDDPATEEIEPMGIALTDAIASAIAGCGY